MKRIATQAALFAALVALVFAPALVAGQGAQPPSLQLPDLIGALKATPGCLGVDAARTTSGKQVIFAWFENKKAVLNWYYSDAHQGLVRQFGASSGRQTPPLSGVPDDAPVLAVASLTMSGPPSSVADMKSALSQIAIELYTPLPGGIAVGGRFAPSALKVPGLMDVPVAALKQP
jgi:hypothetical protein